MTAHGANGSGVTAPAGFLAAAETVGIKRSGPDLALVLNDGPRDAAAGVFTSNRVIAAPVRWTRQVLTQGRLRAVLLNSGCANAATGPRGFQDTHASAERAARALGVGAVDVGVCSTGLIGSYLPMERLLPGVDAVTARLHRGGGGAAARAIMTTDSRPKETVVKGQGWGVGGMAKGAGMLAPALATMIVVLTTDADVDAALCESALRNATRRTFDRVDADGCMSTNDTVLLLASGASGVRPTPAQFGDAVQQACHDLAMQLLADAEGAHHEITISVSGAATEAEALEVGRAIARNSLVKCAVFGGDPNWGRVLAAVGTTAAAYDPDNVDITVNGGKVCVASAPGEDTRTVDLTARAVQVAVDLHAGEHAATLWTTDLTTEYVHENSAYST